MSAYDQIVDWFAAAPTSPTIEWAEVERQLDTALPADYKRLCDRFPPCQIEFFTLLHPLSLYGTPIEVVDTLRWQLGFSADTLANDPGAPDPDSLIAWGSIDSDPRYCWDRSTGSNPDEWSCLIMESHGRYQHLAGNMTTCLRDLITGVQVATVGPPIVEEDQLVMHVPPGITIAAANWTPPSPAVEG